MPDAPPTHRLSRRGALALGLATALAGPRRIRAEQTGDALARRLQDAARRGAAVRLPAGVTTIPSLELPDGARLVGAPGAVLRLAGDGPLLWARAATRVMLEGLTLDGGGATLAKDRGLLDFEDVRRLDIHGCVIKRSPANGVLLRRCGGRFAENLVERAHAAAYHSLDGLGVDIDGNHIRDCGDNGLVVWSAAHGDYDGSRLRNNLIEDIRNVSGGDGPYGNGVAIWKSAGVRVENNRIRRCAYTFVRCSDTSDAAVAGNDCKDCGEKAMYAEFGATRTSFRNNRIEHAGGGIAVTNARSHGTDYGIVTGNTIVNLRSTRPDAEFGPEMFWRTGILGERNCAIRGNTIVAPAWIGVALGGWRENVQVEDNVIDGADYGVAVAMGPDAGEGVVVRNRILHSRMAAVIAFAGAAPAGDDLLPRTGTARIPPRLTLRDNVVE